MAKIPWILLIIFLAGLILLLLPDKGEPVIRFNKLHGPSLLDLTGLILILASWLVSCAVVVKRRKGLIKTLGRAIVYSLVVLYFFSLLGIMAGLILSDEWLLWCCVVVGLVINISLIVSAFRVKL